MDAGRDEEAPLLAASPQRSHAADVHVLSAAFLFVFSAYGAAQNLQSTVNTVRARASPVPSLSDPARS
jgi:hypothetical protein